MRVLWITNSIFPSTCKLLGLPDPMEGGWMYSMAIQISSVQGIQLAVATVYNGLDFRKDEIDGVMYFLLPSKSTKRYQKSLEPLWDKVCIEFNPDIIHIHGTEYTHGLACMRARPHQNYVVSIQGMISVIAKYYNLGISTWDIIKNITLRDVIRFDTLFQAKISFKKRGNYEKEYLERTKHVIGRTNWDYSHSKAINPSLNYHFCNESLRNCFYDAPKWNIDLKKKYTIFLSQASYPIKGLHQVLRALAILKTDFPDIQLRIAGHNLIHKKNIIERFKLSGYSSYIKSLIKKLKVKNNIEFIGPQTESQMVQEYRNAHVFLCSSSIENSPNSLGEAQLIGVPSIASFVGGVPDMIKQGESGLLYRYEEIEMLAEMIRSIFLNDNLTNNISLNGIIAAQERHDRFTNLNNTLGVYQQIEKEE